MKLQKCNGTLFFIISILLFRPFTGSAQINEWGKPADLVTKESTANSYPTRCINCMLISATPSGAIPNSKYISIYTTKALAPNNRKTISLTVGYITDEFSIESDNGSYRFGFKGRTKGLKISTKSSSLMLSYGLADARENEADIRSITADLSTGGNITIFRKLFGIPLGSYIPIRVNVGYRNLSLSNSENDNAHIGTGSLGAGVGSEIRLRTKKSAPNKNLLLSASLVSSAGVIGDFNSLIGDAQSEHLALRDIRLTKGTDYNFEIKLERLIGGRAGITFGLTVRFLYWSREGVEEARQILDVISGKREDLELRAKQTFFRVGINL